VTPSEPADPVPPCSSVPKPRRSNAMEPLILLLVLVGWIALQVWVLPKMGVRT
jgi:hypothetical protein